MVWSKSLPAPSEVPAEVFPDPQKYFIRTRIVIEFQSEKVEGEEHAYSIAYAANPTNVMLAIKHAEELYAELGIFIDIAEIVFRPMKSEFSTLVKDANAHPNYLSIYYMLSQDVGFYGLSGAPWEHVISYGVYLSYGHDEWTFAHELGHYFGLLHTFDDDFIEDTPKQEDHPCEEDDVSKPNCMNIMNYCKHLPKAVTPGQLERMKLFLRAKRHNQIDFKLQFTPYREASLHAAFSF